MKVKKLIIVLAPIGILFVVICAVVSLTRPYFPPRPKNTTLEFWICDDVSSVDWNGHDEITGWMGAREFLGKDYHMSTLTVYPKYFCKVSRSPRSQATSMAWRMARSTREGVVANRLATSG